MEEGEGIPEDGDVEETVYEDPSQTVDTAIQETTEIQVECEGQEFIINNMEESLL